MNKIHLDITSGFNYDWGFIDKISNELNIKCYTYRTKMKIGAKSMVQFNDMNAKVFGDFIYCNYDKIGLPRKYEKYLQIIKIIDKRKPSRWIVEKPIVIKMYANGITYNNIIKEYRIPQTTFYRWIKNYKTEKESV